MTEIKNEKEKCIGSFFINPLQAMAFWFRTNVLRIYPSKLIN